MTEEDKPDGWAIYSKADDRLLDFSFDRDTMIDAVNDEEMGSFWHVVPVKLIKLEEKEG